MGMKEKILSFKKIEEDSNILKCLKGVLLEWGFDRNMSSIIDFHRHENHVFDVAEYVMSYNEIKSWFTDQCSLPFAGKLVYSDSLHDLSSEFLSLCDKLSSEVYRKICEIFKYVQKASSKEQNFQIAIERAKSLGKEVTGQVTPEELVLCDKRDTKDCLVIDLDYKEAFFEFENIDTEFKLINLTKEGWDQALALNNSFEELFDDFVEGNRRWPTAALALSNSVDDFIEGNRRCPTANMGFVLLCELYTRSLLLSKFHLFFGDNEEIFNRFRNIMHECWSENNLVLAAAAVLDPRFKLDIVEYWYKRIYGSEWETQLSLFKDCFADVYNVYARLDSSGKQPYDSLISHTMLLPSERPYKSSNNLEDVWLPISELDLYLKEVKFPLLRHFDILNWWCVGQQNFPTLARMARDFLSINVTVTDDNSYYAYYDLHAVAREHLQSDMVKEALICTKNWLKSP